MGELVRTRKRVFLKEHEVHEHEPVSLRSRLLCVILIVEDVPHGSIFESSMFSVYIFRRNCRLIFFSSWNLSK